MPIGNENENENENKNFTIMDKEYVMSVAKTIQEQLFWSIDKWTYLSWGTSKKVAMMYNNMPTLALRVSGAIHKGWVYISLNEGADCYEVRLLNVGRTQVRDTIEEVYCDNLGTIIDGLIERAPQWNDGQYAKVAMRDSMRKLKSA